MTLACIGLGSNLHHPDQQVRRAIQALKQLPRSRLHCASRLYRSAPLRGPGVPMNQPDYCNAVVLLETQLPPETLLDALQAIEHRQGRRRSPARWGPRPLDLDILLYGEQQIATHRLRVPHPEMGKRIFVLAPLAECADQLRVPGQGTIRELLVQCPPAGLSPWSSRAESDGNPIVEMQGAE